jgi:hypothetical protein
LCSVLRVSHAQKKKKRQSAQKSNFEIESIPLFLFIYQFCGCLRVVLCGGLCFVLSFLMSSDDGVGGSCTSGERRKLINDEGINLVVVRITNNHPGASTHE